MSKAVRCVVWGGSVVLAGLVGWAAWQVGCEARERRVRERERAEVRRTKALVKESDEAEAVQAEAEWQKTLEGYREREKPVGR